MQITRTIVIVLCSVALLNGCARNIETNIYSAASVGETSFTYQGTIISSRKVTVQQSEHLEENRTGIGVGSAAGGLAGLQVGQGSGNIAATVGGMVIGGIVGSLVEKKLKSQEGMEYVVKLTNNQLLTVVQGLDVILSIGQPVLVLVSHDGRSRIIADNSPVQEVQTPLSAPTVKINKKR